MKPTTLLIITLASAGAFLWLYLWVLSLLAFAR